MNEQRGKKAETPQYENMRCKQRDICSCKTILVFHSIAYSASNTQLFHGIYKTIGDHMMVVNNLVSAGCLGTTIIIIWG
jgi:hypothetical protein